MTNAWIIAALLIGGGLGLFYFGGLWMTVRRAACAPQPELLFCMSFLMRTGAVLLGFYMLTGGRWERLAAGMAGFLLARTLLIRLMRNSEFPCGAAAYSPDTPTAKR